MDKMNKEVSEKFKQTFASLTNTYNDWSKDINQSHILGKKEVYEEVLNWLTTSQNNDYKYISPNLFHNMMNEKLTKTCIALNSRSEVDDIMKVFSNIKLNENKKKNHRNIKPTEPREDGSFNTFPMNMQSSIQAAMNNNTISNSSHHEDSSDESITSMPPLQKKKK